MWMLGRIDNIVKIVKLKIKIKNSSIQKVQKEKLY